MKLYERIELVAQDFPISTPITNEDLKKFKLSKDICKLVERGILRKLDVGIYTLDENYEENSKRRKTYQKFEDKMTNLLKKYKVNDIISNKDLRVLGFESHMVARLVQDGYLASESYREYKLLKDSYQTEKKKEEVEQDKYFGLCRKEIKLNNLCESVLEGKELTTKSLCNECGFTINDLTLLVKKEILKRVTMGHYEFNDADLIFQYRLKVSGLKASKCIDIAYEINKEHKEANLRLFKRNIANGYYNNACKYLEFLYFNDSEYKKYYSLYIFLLNMIIKLPPSLKNIANSLTFIDIDIANENADLRKVLNRIYNNKLFGATNDILLYMEDSMAKAIILDLLKATTKKKQIVKPNYREEFKKYVSLNDFESLASLIEAKPNKNVVDNYALKLTNIIIQVKNTLEIPNRRLSQASNVFSVIDDKDFELALNLTIDFNTSKNLPLSNNYLYLLLVKLVNMIKVIAFIKNDDYEKLLEYLKKNNDIENKEELIVLTEAIITLKNGNDINILEHKFSDINNNILKALLDKYLNFKKGKEEINQAEGMTKLYFLLINGYINEALSYVHEYLENLNLLKYEFLIIDLIKLSLIEYDLAFTRVFYILTLLKRGVYVPDYNLYVSYFYQAIQERNLEEAKLYFDIVKRFKDMGELDISIENMRRLLANLMAETTTRGR